MSLFFETLYINNGTIRNLDYHNMRLNRTIEENFSIKPSFDLSQIVDTSQTNTRCKIIYNDTIQKIEYHPVTKRDFKCFKIIESDIDCRYKYLDRRAIEKLFEMRGECDDIIIVRNGLIADTSIANIAIFDGKHWITPAVPLLPGTMRASLIEEGKLLEKDISVGDVLGAEKIAVMNAIVGFYILGDDVLITI